MSRVLLLNVTYEPIRVVSLRRAVVLVLDDKAEIVEHHDTELRSANNSIPTPSVIRLKYFVKIPYKARLPLTRRTVIARDNGDCQYCGKRGDTIDHVKPRSKGGQHVWENVVCACRRCNAKKGSKTLEQLGWSLERKPFAPRGTRWLIIGYTTDPRWEPYLALVE